VPEYTLAASTVRAYLGNGDGTFTLGGATSTPSEGSLVLADFKHGGKLDLATSGNLIALGNGDGTFQPPTSIVATPPANGFSRIAAGDINNDGWPDLVLTGDNVLVLLNNRHGGFTQVPLAIVGSTPILADLNGDGNLDLIVLSTTGNSSAYFGDGQGGFTFKVGFRGQVFLVADVNGDGIPDVGTSAFGTLEIYLGESGATYAAPFAIGALLGSDRMVVEDLHGPSPASGLPDLVVPGFSGIQVLFNLTK